MKNRSLIDEYRDVDPREIVNRLGFQTNGSGHIPCPHHEDKNPSLKLYDDHAYCFSCGKRLNSIDLVMDIKGCDFHDATAWIASEFKLARLDRDPKTIEQYNAKKEITGFYNELVHEGLKQQEVAVEYLTERGIGEEIVKKHGAGFLPRTYKPNNWDLAKKAGCISQNNNFMFQGRITIPIERRGETVSLYGRSLSESDKRPRHVYPGTTEPQLPRTLWNQDRNRTKKEVYICESIIDGMTLETYGYPAISTLGANGCRSPEVLESLVEPKFTKLLLTFDTEKNGAGQKAAIKLGSELIQRGIATEVIEFPLENGNDKTDPNSYFLTHTREDFDKLPRTEFTEHWLSKTPKSGTPEEVFNNLSPLIDTISKTKPALWGMRISKICEYFPNLDRRRLDSCIASKSNESNQEGQQEGYYPRKLVDEIQEDGPIIYSGNQTYKYRDGYYQEIRKEEINKMLWDLLGPKARSSQVEESRKCLEALRYVRPEKVNPPGVLNFNNGILNVQEDSWEEDGHSPDILSTIRINITFDPKAKCPLWEKTLEELLPDQDQVLLLQEFSGLSLTPDVTFQKLLAMYGLGANGKSVITDVLISLVGKDNCSMLELKDFSERFRTVHLRDKLLNISSESDINRQISDSAVKKVISGEDMPGEYKGRDIFFFRPFAKVIVACNNLPKTNDRSYGWIRRWMILHFQQTIPDDPKKRDPHRAQRIIQEELPGVLNWAIEGYRRLTKNKGFTIPESSKQIMKAYRKEIAPELIFIEDHIVKGVEGDKAHLKEVYEGYQDWCKSNGRAPLSKQKLHIEIKRALNLNYAEPPKDNQGNYFPSYFYRKNDF